MPAPVVGPGGPRWSRVWDAPGSRLLVVSQDSWVDYLDPSSGKLERGFPFRGELASVAPDGKRLVSLDRNRSLATLYDELGKEQRRFAHPGRIHRATLTHQGKLLVTVNLESEIRVWDPDTGKARLRLPKVEGPGDSATAFVTVTAVSRDGKTLLAGTKDGEVLRWDLATGKALTPLRPHHLYWVTGLFCQTDGRTLVSVAGDNVVRRTDLMTGKTASSGDGFVGHTSVARSPVGPTAAVGDSRGRLEL